MTARQTPSEEDQALQAAVAPVVPPADPKTGKPKATPWDNASLDPNKRKSIAEDPEGKANAKLSKK